MTIPLKTLIQALEALKSAEAVFDKQLDGTGNWCKTMQARVGLEYYMNRILDGQNVTVEQDIERSAGMNYHDTRFARRMGETPLRPDYASAIERTPGHQTRGDLAVKWTVLFGLVFVGCLLVLELL